MFNLFKILKFKKAKADAPQLLKCSTCPYENELVIYFKNKAVMRITRRSCTPLQNELSAIIPRAELRRRRYENGKVVVEEELVLNSITLVDGLRHGQRDKTGKCQKGQV